MSLSEFSYYVRKFGPIALVGFLVFIISFVIVRTVFTAATAPKPTQVTYEPPLGILPPIPFTYTVDYPPNYTFTIDNIEGRPLTDATEAPVFFIPPSRTRFGYQQTVALMAKAVGINTEDHSYTLDDVTATYQDDIRTLNVDITNFNYDFEVDLQKVTSALDEAFIPTETKIEQEAKSFLRQMDKFPPELAKGRQNIIYLRYSPETDDVEVVDTPEEANIVEVDFFPPDIQEFPSLSPKYFNSHIYVTMIFRDEGNIVVKSSVQYFPEDPNSGGLYPLKSGDQAWSELINGEGTIVSPSKGSTDIIVRNMFVGYYYADTYFPYLMPVYVFLGDNGFAAYVSAVENQYIEGAQQPTQTPQ